MYFSFQISIKLLYKVTKKQYKTNFNFLNEKKTNYKVPKRLKLRVICESFLLETVGFLYFVIGKKTPIKKQKIL